MPLETDLQAATTAMNRLSANLEKYGPGLAGLGGASTTVPAAEKKADTKADKKAEPVSKYTAEDIHAMASKVKEKKGTDSAKALIGATGSKNIAELKTKPEKFDEFMAACEAAIGGAEDDGL